MADSLLGLLGGGGNTGGMDLNQLVRPPDPLGDALAAMSERFAQAGQASRLPTSTLGALGSALGGASTAARASQTQYLDQAIKLQALRKAYQQAGFDAKRAELFARWALQSDQSAPGATPAVTPGPLTPAPAAPVASPAVRAVPTAAPGAPSITAPPLPGDFGATGEYGGGQNGLLAPPTPGSPDTVIPSVPGGPAATPASFRPAAMVAPDGRAGAGAGDAGSGLDLRGLLSLASAGGGAADPFAGLLATDAPIQAGGPDTLVKSGDQSQLPIERASAPPGVNPLDIISKYESGGRNIPQGIVPPEVSSASGPWQMLNSTFRETAAKHNIDVGDAKRAMDAPIETQRAVAQALYNDKGYAPWAPYNPRLAAAVGYEGGGGRPNVQLAQYAPGGGQGGAPALVGPGSGRIPGLNMTPNQLAILDAFSSLAGDTSKPFKDFLDIYYKSPEYLRLSEQEKAAGGRAVTEPSDIRILQQKAVEDRVSKQLEQAGNARYSLAPNGILVPDGQGGQTRVQATVEQAVRAANGLPVPELGIKGMYPDTSTKGGAAPGGAPASGDTTRPAGPLTGEPTATLPPGYEWRRTPQGAFAAQPIPNTPAAEEARAVAQKKAQADQQLQISRDIVVQNADRLEDLAKNSMLPITGAGGSLLSRLGGTAANDARVLIETLKSRSSLDALNQMRQASPTGAALGNVSNAEGDRLAAAMVNLDQSQTQEQFLFNLRRAKQAYIDAVHGPGAYAKLPDEPVLKVPGATGTAAPSGAPTAPKPIVTPYGTIRPVQ